MTCPSQTATKLGTNRILSDSKASALRHYAPLTLFNNGLNLKFLKPALTLNKVNTQVHNKIVWHFGFISDDSR